MYHPVPGDIASSQDSRQTAGHSHRKLREWGIVVEIDWFQMHLMLFGTIVGFRLCPNKRALHLKRWLFLAFTLSPERSMTSYTVVTAPPELPTMRSIIREAEVIIQP